MANINKLMKQAAQMQRQMETIHAELAERTVEYTSGGGAVKAVATCDGAVKSISIEPSAVDPEDVSILEEMILTAINGALAKGKEVNAQEMGKLTAGMGGFPGMM